MVDINPTMCITLNVNTINTGIKKQTQDWILTSKAGLHDPHKKYILNIKM